MTTLVCIGARKVNNKQYLHGDELPPGAMSRDEADKLLDERLLYASNERRSLYRLFHAFSGCRETEQLSKAELTTLALPE